MSRIEEEIDDKGGDDRGRGGKGGRGGASRRKVCRFCTETTTLIDSGVWPGVWRNSSVTSPSE